MKQFEFERVWNAKVFPRRLALPLHCCLSLTACQTRRRRRRRLSSSGPNVDIINSCRKLIKCKLSNHIIISYGSHKSNTHKHTPRHTERRSCVLQYTENVQFAFGMGVRRRLRDLSLRAVCWTSCALITRAIIKIFMRNC